MTAMESAERTATYATQPLKNVNYAGAHIIITTSGVQAGAAVTFKVEGWDMASQNWYEIIESEQVITVRQIILRILFGASPVPNLVVNDQLPLTFRIVAEHTNSLPITYSVGVNFIKG